MFVRPNIDLCILIPYYNNFTGLIRSVNSIACPTNNCLVLVVDDGSAVPLTSEAVDQHLPAAVKLQILRMDRNTGITKALNHGLDFIYKNFTTRFIARLDCGDMCTSDRFIKQMAFFETNPTVHLLGTWCYFKNFSTGTAYQYITPTAHKCIKKSMHYKNVFIHPTVMWRRSGTGELKYPEQYPHAEDYGLFYEMISRIESAILNEFLVSCEVNSKGISIANRPVQLRSRMKVMSHYNKNKLRGVIAIIRLKLLMLLPHNIIFATKKIIYGIT